MATPFNAASTYAAKLKDPRWQKKRLEVLQRADWACEVCGDKESTLHVHHKRYFKGREPWEYDDDQLAVLCESCHEATHDAPDLLLEAISRLPIDGIFGRDSVARLISGLTNQRPSWESGSLFWHAGWLSSSVLMRACGNGHLTREDLVKIAFAAEADPKAFSDALLEFASRRSTKGAV